MNANELAEELHDLDVQASQQSLNDWAEQAATMLRQLQEEINISENLIKHLHSENKELRNENSQLQAENEALKRPNNVVGVPQDKLTDMQVTIRQLQAENEALKEKIKWLKGKELLKNE